ncbi:hypothetical protein VTO42DRAFT_3112 [Malbranchea cinnamomea]
MSGHYDRDERAQTLVNDGQSRSKSRLHGLSGALQALPSHLPQIKNTGSDPGPKGLTVLHAPPGSKAKANLVFVHGLRGGSYKTWRKSGDPRSFWPQTWLADHPDLRSVRICTFGYNCDLTVNNSGILNLHDAGRYLFNELRASPQLREDDESPIILIGHSIGGLVTKKAFALSCQDPISISLAGRIRAIVFLATPHRSSDSPELLEGIVRASGETNSKPYINVLTRQSPPLQAINDDFRIYAGNLQFIISFYEAYRTKTGWHRQYIVDKGSATLGYKNEIVDFLYTDHQGMSRFETPDDANFRMLKGRLVDAVKKVTMKPYMQGVVSKSTDATAELHSKHVDMRTLSLYLATSNYPEDDLLSLENVIGANTCHWINQKPGFQEWYNDVSSGRSLYWLTSKPGTGKSVLAAYLVRRLRSQGRRCAFYFFKHRDRAKRLSSAFLRSLAYQLADVNQDIRRVLLSMYRAGTQFDRDDSRAIWRALFAGMLLGVKAATPHYIIIDGLDECADASTLMGLLNRTEGNLPIRIFVTSRPTLECERYFDIWRPHLTHATISNHDTLHDIRVCLNGDVKLRVFSDEQRQIIVDKIIRKCFGSFLWARLAVQEIMVAQSLSRIDNILDSFPAEMESHSLRSFK